MLKYNFRLSVICLVFSVLFTSCNNDKDDIVSNSNTAVVIKKININEIKNRDIVETELNDLNRKRQNVFSRETEEDGLLDFTVITDQVKYFEQGDYHTYTFAVFRENPLENIQENILLELRLDGTYKPYLVRYHLTEEQFEEAASDISILEGAIVEYVPLEDDEVDISEDLFQRCNISYTTVIVQVPIEGCNCWQVYTYIDDISFSVGCYSNGNGGGSGDGGSGGTGGPGGGSVPPYGSGSTSPFPLSEITDINGNTFNADIIKLNAITSNSTIKDRINQMNSVINTSSTELGSEFRTTSTVNQYSEYQVPASDVGFDYTKFPDAISTSKVRLHMHHNTTNSNNGKIPTVFSAEDIFGMAKFYKQKEDLGTADSYDITSILLSRRGLYALRVTDENKLNQFILDLNTNLVVDNEVIKYSKLLVKIYKKKVLGKTKDACGNCTDAQEEALFELYFTTFFKKLDSGLSLYRAFSDSDGNYSWEVLN